MKFLHSVSHWFKPHCCSSKCVSPTASSFNRTFFSLWGDTSLSTGVKTWFFHLWMWQWIYFWTHTPTAGCQCQFKWFIFPSSHSWSWLVNYQKSNLLLMFWTVVTIKVYHSWPLQSDLMLFLSLYCLTFQRQN